MKLVTYRASVEAEARLGVVVGDQVLDAEALGEVYGEDIPSTMLDLIDTGRAGVDALREIVEEAGDNPPIHTSTALANVKLLAPIPRPRKNIFGIGLNYLDHITESAKALDTDDALPKEPVVFSKPPTAVIGPGDAIRHDSSMTQQLDWEVELAVIIGRQATRVAREDALGCVFGYSVMIDVSARRLSRALT